LLAAGQAEARGVELVLDLVPQRAAASAFSTGHPSRISRSSHKADTERDVFHRSSSETRRFWNTMPTGTQQVEIELGSSNVCLVQHQLAGGALAGIEVDIRLKIRSKVDLPRRNGPMKAVTRWVPSVYVDVFSAWFCR